MKVEINKTYTITLDEKEKTMLKDVLNYFNQFCSDKEDYEKEIEFSNDLYNNFEKS